MASGSRILTQLFVCIIMISALNAKHRVPNYQTSAMGSSFTCESQRIFHHNVTQGFPPRVKMSCTQLTVKVDQSVDITCEVTSGTFAKVTWYLNGKPPQRNHVTVNRGTCGQTLKVRSADIRDSGNYTCRVANSNGIVSNTCVLTVMGDKRNEVQIEDLKLSGRRKKAILGGRAKLICFMLNADVATWFKNSKRLRTTERHVWRTRHIFNQQGIKFSLIIINVTTHDEGWYMCLGFNNGKVVKKTFFLQTETCPKGYHCPHNTNRAVRCPSVSQGVWNKTTHAQLIEETDSAILTVSGGAMSHWSLWIEISFLIGFLVTRNV